MSQKKRPDEVFNELKQYMGKVIRVARGRRGTTKQELADSLSRRFLWRLKEKEIELIETGKRQILFYEFQWICIVLGYTQEIVLSVALFLRANANKTLQEIEEEMIEQMEFDKYKESH